MLDRVVITGTGTVNSVGLSVPETWQKMLAGKSGIGPLTLFHAPDLPVYIAGEVKGFNPEHYLSSKEIRRRDRFEHFAAAAVKEAVQQAGLNGDSVDRTRVGVFISSSIGGVRSLQEGFELLLAEGQRKVSPFVIPMFMVNGAAAYASLDYGFQGPSLCVDSACASSSDGIGMAWMMIRNGLIDAAVAGGSDATVTLLGVSAFNKVGALSRRNQPEPDGSYCTPRPFDKNRDGLVMGEGAAVLVLEREAHARARGVPILAELAGYGTSSDAYHITAPLEDGGGGAKAIHMALRSADIGPEDVDYINAHGTATLLNDSSETHAIKAALGKWAYNIPVSSTKSMTGHMMGATSALEVILCTHAVREDRIPPTINYETPDPDCDLDYIPNQYRSHPTDIAISNSFGFGGHNSVLVVKKYS